MTRATPARSNPASDAVAPKLVLCELADASRFGVESFSPFCLKVHRALRAAGLDYERRHTSNPGAFRSLNPTGQVPILLIDGRPLADSTEILRAIEAFAPRSLQSFLSPAQAGEAWLYEELADTALNGFLMASRWLDERNWPRVRHTYFVEMPAPVRAIVPSILRRRVRAALVARDIWRAGADACWTRFQRLLDSLDARAPTAGAWVGDSISIADVAIFGQVQGFRTDLTPWQREQVNARTRLASYLDRVDGDTRKTWTAVRAVA